MYGLLFCIMIMACILSCNIEFQVFGQAEENGKVKQIVGGNLTQFYIEDVKYSVNAEGKEVHILMVFKNLDANPQYFYPNMIRLIDSQDRQYEADYSSNFPSIYIPPADILKWDALFKIVPSNNFSKLYFTPDGSESKLTVDLTKNMNPAEKPPTSEWKLTPNKGAKMSNTYFAINVNDEKYVGKTYVIDVTIENLWNSPINISPSDFIVKDEQGKDYSYNLFFDLISPLLSGSLSPSEKVRGDIAFDVNSTSGNKMIIYSGIDTALYLNSGKSSQNRSNLNYNKLNSVEIALESSDPNSKQSYIPASLSISKGETVEWINNDTTLHTVTSGTAESGPTADFDSSYLAAGKTFEHKFDKAGTFDYYCTLHPFMKGKIVVN